MCLQQIKPRIAGRDVIPQNNHSPIVEEWDLKRYGHTNLHRCPRIVAEPGQPERYDIPTPTRQSPTTRRELEGLICYPSFLQEDYEMLRWAYLPRSVTQGYMKWTAGSLRQVATGTRDIHADWYIKELEGIRKHGMACVDIFRKCAPPEVTAGWEGLGMLKQPVLDTNSLMKVMGMKDECLAADKMLQRQITVVYVICYHLAWVAWFRIWCTFQVHEMLDAEMVDAATRIPQDCRARFWLLNSMNPTHPGMTPAIDDCIGAVLHTGTSYDRWKFIAGTGIACFDLVLPDRLVYRRSRPTGLIWVADYSKPMFRKSKWLRVRLGPDEVVEHFGFLGFQNVEPYVRRVIREARRDAEAKYLLMEPGDRCWEETTGEPLPPLDRHFDDRTFDDDVYGPLDSDTAPTSSHDPMPTPGPATPTSQQGDITPTAGGPSRKRAAESIPPALPPQAKKANAESESRAAERQAERERREKLIKYQRIPLEMWRGLYLRAREAERTAETAADKKHASDVLRLIEIRKRLVEGVGRRRFEFPKGKTAYYCAKTAFEVFHDRSAFLAQYLKELENGVGFPAVPAFDRWDDGVFEHLKDQPFTAEDANFVEEMGRAFPDDVKDAIAAAAAAAKSAKEHV